LRTTNPYWLAFAPYAVPGSVTFGDFASYLGVCLAASAVLLALAVARLRPVTIRQAGQPAKVKRASASSRRRLGLFHSSLDGNPVLWREWHRRRPSRWGRLIWGIYALLAISFSALVVMHKFSSGGGTGDIAPVVIAFQVVVGLLLVSVASPNPLAEERARGSLDILLATPLSSRSILWGKWWGTYRTVPRLALLPFVTIFLVALHNDADRLGGTLLLAVLVLAYGAALTSLGLALAIWTSRLGRAVTWSVVAYVLVTLGWLMLIVLLVPRQESGAGLAMGSPLFGTAFLSALIDFPRPRQSEYDMAVGWGIFWSGFYLTAAVVLYRAALATFDRCLGRMSERHHFLKPARRPARREMTPVR
jgi:ABC-type transport system involved in multi-copper enzyme maturation permease subunit